MPRHDDGEVGFDVPRDWDNRTLVAYAAPQRPGQEQAANLVVSRERLPEGEGLEGYAARQVAELAERLEDFQLLAHGGRELGGQPALSLRFSSKGRDGRFEQTLVLAAVGRRVFAFTMSAPERDVAQVGPLFERMLASVRFPTPAHAGDAR
ncbi:MAG: DcrB-related protein [Myxococcales bacterium]|nr:DcrB-related protein [Myxococcales bacterium]